MPFTYHIHQVYFFIALLSAHCGQFLSEMKARTQSHQFPEYMSQYSRGRDSEDKPQAITQQTSDSIFHRRAFQICDILGNFQNGFILIHFEGFLFLVDQHAASEKSLFLQYLISPQKYTCPADYKCYLPNYYRETLRDKQTEIEEQGWRFQEVGRKAGETVVRVTEAPLLYGKELREDDFVFLVDKLYSEREGDENSYSINERNSMASFACHNAIKVGDRLRIFEMRGLLDSLYKMDAPFNCPHGRPIIVALGKISQRRPAISYRKQYQL